MAVNSARPQPMILAASLAFMLGFGSACGGGGEEAQCASRVDFTTTQYDGTLAHAQIPLGDQLGEGTFPACDDGNSGEESPAETVTVRAIDGIDPHIAVAVETDEDTVYIKHGLNSDKYPHELKRLIGKN